MTESKTHAQRRAQGLDVLDSIFAHAGGRAVAERLAERGAFGSFAIDYVFGEIWARDQLSRRDRNLVVIAFLATLGREIELTNYVRAAAQHGISNEEVDEVILQIAGYAGFPFGVGGMRAVDEARAGSGDDATPSRKPAAEKSDDQRRADAVDVMRTLTNGRAAADPDTARAGIVEALGGVGALAFDFAFGELWSRDQLSRRDRSLVVVSILAALSKEQELAFHVPGALNHGVTREEIEEVMVTLCGYGGFPRAVEGMRAARAAFALIDERNGDA